jgi:hypothetical protein
MIKILFVLFFLPLMVSSQAIVSLQASDFPDAIVSEPVTYDLTTILEYNNDADLFMEFGFTALLVQDIVWKDATIKVEVYQLGSPDAAFGAYALSLVDCLDRDTIAPYDCNNQYQYQLAHGNLYVSISSQSGSETARSKYFPVARSVMQHNPMQDLIVPPPFDIPEMQKWKKNLVYIQGPIGLQNSLYPWQEIFLTVRFSMYAIYLPDPRNSKYLARINFETNNDMMRFLGLAGLLSDGTPVPNTSTNDGLYRAWQQYGDQEIYFLQCQEPWTIEALTNPRK